jgi:hypothetical protein
MVSVVMPSSNWMLARSSIMDSETLVMPSQARLIWVWTLVMSSGSRLPSLLTTKIGFISELFLSSILFFQEWLFSHAEVAFSVVLERRKHIMTSSWIFFNHTHTIVEHYFAVDN